MKQYHHTIVLPVPFVPYQAKFESFREMPLDMQLINKEFTTWLENLGIMFCHGRFFNSRPYQKYAIHLDGTGGEDVAKLNLVFDSTDTIMNWYEPLPGYTGSINNNQLNKPVLYYEIDKCKLLHTTSVNTHCLLNGSIAHDMHNGSNNGQFRKCYSLTLVNIKTSQRLTWPEAVEILNPYLLK